MAGPIIVEGPDGQEYEFPEGTSPDVMKQAMRKRYAAQGTPAPAPPPVQQPQTRNTIRTAPREFPTSSDRMSGREDTQIIVQAQRALAAQQEAERLARVKPVEQAAATAGAKASAEAGAKFKGPVMAALAGPSMQIAGMGASEGVYNDAGVMSAPTAATTRGVNSIAFGVPAIVNKDFREDVAMAGRDQPGASLVADVVGFLAPGIGTWNTTRAAVNAFARPFIPRGADAASRTVRYGAPVTGQVAGASAQNAAFQAGVQEPIRAEMAGEDLTLAGMGEAAQRGAKDPLNFLPVGLSAVNRTWNTLTSGIATPSARAAEMANRFGVGPRQTAASQGIAQTTQQLGGQLQGADIRGLTNIENALRFALRDNRNIPDVNARIATGFERIRQSLPLEDDPTLNLARLIEREFAPDAPQTRDIIRNFLRGVGLNSPGGGQIVGDAANQMRGQQADVLRTELESSFGAQPKTEANAAMQQSLDQFSAAYNTVLGAAPRQGPQVDRALELLAREPQAAAILDDIAQSQNLTIEQFIERNPLQALHEVQSELATQARALAARGDAGAGPLEITVRNMQRPLRDAVPGYGDLQGLWRQWTQARERMGYVRGAAAGTGGELSTVPGFGDKIFGPGGIAKSEMGTQTAADLYLQMDDLSQRAAGLSVRDVINDELRKGKAAGLEERYQTAANMRRVATEGGLDALRRVFGEAGDRVARRIEQFMDANEFARNIDPEFNSATMNKAQAMQTGAQPFAGPMGQATQSAAGSLGQNAVGDAFMMASGITSAPVLSALRFAPWLANRLQPGARTQRNIAETLLRRGQIGSQVPPRPGGPAPITPIDPAMVPSAGPAPGGPPPGSLPPTGGAPPQAPRTVGVAPAAASVPAGAPVPTTPIRTTGIGIGPNAQATLQQSAFGSIGGSAYGSQNDVNQDGVIDEQDAYAGAFLGGVGVPVAAGGLRTVGRPRTPSGRTVGQGGYFGRQSMRPPGSGPSPREIELRQEWSTATPIVTQARTTAQSAQQAADAALQSKAPADIARAKDQKKALVGQLKEAQASRAGMDTPEDARLAETLASLAENTSDPVLLSTQISAARTSLDRLLTDLGGAVEGNLIPVRTTVQTRTQAPRSAAEPAPERPSVTRYAEGGDEVKPQGFGASPPKTPQQAARFETPGSPEYEAAVAKGLDMSTPARMARAKDMGFDTETVYYRGMTRPAEGGKFTVNEGDWGPGVYVGNAGTASSYSRSIMEGAAPIVYPLYIRGKMMNVADYQDLQDAVRKSMTPAQRKAEGAKNAIDLEAQRRAKEAGFVGVEQFRAVYDGKSTTGSALVFDPSNIRSVNAAFDPEKSTSSTLLAAAPFAAVGGAGLTLAGEDARNQRTVGKPKASQSARTVGKAKTN